MPYPVRTWQDELATIDGVMKAISGITDPEELVSVYWNGIGDLVPTGDYVALSRRGEASPNFLITRSSRFTEHPNPWTERHKLPRLSGGILGEIIYGNRPVVIEDLPSRLRRDDPGWFYLQGFSSLYALPQYDSGEGLNATCMLRRDGESFDVERMPLLHWHSGLFGRGTQNLVLRNQLAQAHAELDREMQVVGEIQRSLLPQSLPSIPGLDIAAYYRTSTRAGGDYYDFFPLADGGWGIFIADVSGHGTPAAVLMAITHAIAHAQPGTHAPPAALLHYLNARLTPAYTSSGTFITAFYAVFDPVRRRLSYASAGHNPPRLLRGDSVISLDENGALPLGIFAETKYAEASIDLERGDLLVLYTDGISEAMPPRNKEGARPLFGVGRMDEVLRRCGAARAEECVAAMKRAVAEFTQDAPPADDQTLIAMRCAS